jgi:hypothetical protein
MHCNKMGFASVLVASVLVSSADIIDVAAKTEFIGIYFQTSILIS